MAVKTVILDLGNVLIPVDFGRCHAELQKLGAPPVEEVAARLQGAGIVDRFESGTISADDFFDKVSRALRLDIAEEKFWNIWNSMYAPEPAIPETLLAGLRRNVRLLLLSNTNPIHFAMVNANHTVLRHFDDLILSFKIGAMKPDARMYQAALAKSGCRPEECLFVDDLLPFVAGARTHGIDAVQFQSLDQLQHEFPDPRRELVETPVPALDSVVIGAGPAGLAVSQQLGAHHLQHRIFERGAAVGDSWRRYYDSLVLHTGKHGSRLPGMPFANSVPLFPRRLDVLEYLETYASTFALPVEFNTTVSRVTVEGKWFQIETNHGTRSARTVIVTTGLFSNPYRPRFENDTTFEGRILHSSEYRSPESFLNGRTLVIGAGNSGAEIAAELAVSGADVAISIRSGVAVQPLMFLGIPIQYWGIVLLHLPSSMRWGISRTFGRLQARRQTAARILPAAQAPLPEGRVPVIGNRLLRAVESGKLQLRTGVTRFGKNSVKFIDGNEESYSHVILATGYRPAITFVEDLARNKVPGLFFVGLHNSLAGTLWHVRHEAERVPLAVKEFLRQG